MNTQGALQEPQTPPNPGPGSARTSDALMWSWVLLVLLPVSFFAGFAAAHLPYVWFNREEGESGPWWFNLLVGVIGIGITWLPVGGSLFFGRRALRAGSRAAWVPISLGLLLTAFAAALIVLSVFG